MIINKGHNIDKVYLCFWYGHYILMQDRIKLLDFTTFSKLFSSAIKNVLLEGEKDIVEKYRDRFYCDRIESGVVVSFTTICFCLWNI